MIGLNIAGKPVLRAYSIASPNWHDEFEFYSIKVKDGPLTSKLQQLKEGDTIIFRLNLISLNLNFIYFGVRMLFLIYISFEISLSIARDEDKTPE